MKRCLKKTVGKACLNMIELNTILTEVEAMLNSRPLTYPYTDLNDTSPPTRSHKSYRKWSRSRLCPSQISITELTQRAKYYETVTQAIWARGQTEYLTSLREHHRYRKKTSNKKTGDVAKGDVILMHDNTPRNQWKVGVVSNLRTGKRAFETYRDSILTHLCFTTVISLFLHRTMLYHI